jgi:hypothetical protein
MSRQTLLLNWVYYPPVGHAVEAFKLAKGFSAANPDVEIHLLLNSRTAVELADACDWIVRAYAVDLEDISSHGDSAACLEPIPKIWDYIVNDHRPTASPFFFAQSLRTFHDLAESHFSARRWRGGHHELPPSGPPFYQRNATIRLSVPEFSGEYSRLVKPSGPKFCLLLGGSSDEPIYPTVNWWLQAIDVLLKEWPTAQFFVTGKSVVDERSSTLCFSPQDLATLVAASPRIVDCYDIGLWNQLALLNSCHALIAPHTGFAFLAPCVGTPWIAISGVRWPECFFNDVPFYSVLPECRHYPCWADMKPECANRMQERKRVLCMDEELLSRLDDLVQGTRLVLNPEFSFEQARKMYEQRIDLVGSARERFFQIS